LLRFRRGLGRCLGRSLVYGLICCPTYCLVCYMIWQFLLRCLILSNARRIGRWHRNSRIFTSYAVLASILRCGGILERAVFGSIGRYDRRLRNAGLTYGCSGSRV